MKTITNSTLRDLHTQWEEGRTKVDIERTDFGIVQSHGKWITARWREIGLETEKPHPLVLEVARLKSILDYHGITA